MSQAKQIQETQEQLNWHWRNSMRTVRFFAFDARAAFPFGILLFRLVDPYAWGFAIASLLFFRFLEQRGLTFSAALRSFRVLLSEFFFGLGRPGLVGAYRRKFRDFG